MVLYKDKKSCFGCGVCGFVCPKQAISIEQDEQGFNYPKVNSENCVNCGLCFKVCSLQKKKQTPHTVQCYGVKNTNVIRQYSSSGGIFTALANYIIDNDGICIGAMFDENMRVVHDSVSTKDNVIKLCGSKYVQSETTYIYDKVIKMLKNGRKVLYTGTPCQVAALKSLIERINIDGSNLVLVDLICHGVPSPGVWSEYVKFLEKKVSGKLVEFSFRNKKKGWMGYHILAKFDNGKCLEDNDATQSYIRLFSRDIMLRPSCYECPYATKNREGDITIGDFWGIEKIDTDFFDNIGVSLVLVNNDRGQKLFDDVTSLGEILCKEYDASNVAQPNLCHPTKKDVIYNRFWKNYQKGGFKRVAHLYGGYGGNQFVFRIRDSILYRLKKRNIL